MEEDIATSDVTATLAAWALASEDETAMSDQDSAFYDDSENLYLTPT